MDLVFPKISIFHLKAFIYSEIISSQLFCCSFTRPFIQLTFIESGWLYARYFSCPVFYEIMVKTEVLFFKYSFLAKIFFWTLKFKNSINHWENNLIQCIKNHINPFINNVYWFNSLLGYFTNRITSLLGQHQQMQSRVVTVFIIHIC